MGLQTKKRWERTYHCSSTFSPGMALNKNRFKRMKTHQKTNQVLEINIILSIYIYMYNYIGPPKPAFLEVFMAKNLVLSGQNLYFSWFWGLKVYIYIYNVFFFLFILGDHFHLNILCGVCCFFCAIFCNDTILPGKDG